MFKFSQLLSRVGRVPVVSQTLSRNLVSTPTYSKTCLLQKNGLLSQPKRFLNIHEFQSMKLLMQYGASVPRFHVAHTPAEAEVAAEDMGGVDLIVKAQVLAGGRGKGHFLSGFQGGVQAANSALEARSLAAKMLHQRLVTKQTDANGKPCNSVIVTERLYCRRETYLAIMMDRDSGCPIIIASSQGGMDIEQVAATNPKAIIKEKIPLRPDGTAIIEDATLDRICSVLGFGTSSSSVLSAEEQAAISAKKPQSKQVLQAKKNIQACFDLFLKEDATLVEINPMVETHDGRVLCVDAKLNFDDNALFRHEAIAKMRDHSQEDPREVEADKHNLNYIGLDGSIGCLVNGAGLAMATLDIITMYGGKPANFLDIGGGATKDQVMHAFKLLSHDPHVEAILVNIFGGIMRCDIIALGIIAAVEELGLKKPVVVRLAGTNVVEAKKLIEESGLRILPADDLDDAAKRVVRVSQIMKMAKEAALNVQFEIPL